MFNLNIEETTADFKVISGLFDTAMFFLIISLQFAFDIKSGQELVF